VTLALATLRTAAGAAAALVVGDRAWLLRDLGDAKLNRSVKDLIRLDNPMQIDLVRGKAQDTMAPFGPVVVPAPRSN
jgi:hypothetical protein